MKTRVVRLGGYLLLWGYAAAALIPLIIMLLDSLRPNREVLSHPLALPSSLDFSSYSTAWTQASSI
jgi:raffinose/stachyose/melibiose transport system permease protein